jgi:hypothetical protein
MSNKKPKSKKTSTEKKLNKKVDDSAKHELQKKQREIKRKLREQRKKDEETTQQRIFSATEGTVEDFDLKKKRLLIEFPDGRKTTEAELEEIVKIILNDARDYMITFRAEYYDEMRRLTGYKRLKKNPNYNPSIFAIYTIKYAYGRFNLKELIRYLQSKNPFLAGLNCRNFKHFQLLDDEHYSKLKGEYIEDMIRVMKTCKKWHQFESKYSKMYDLAFPDDLFEKY